MTAQPQHNEKLQLVHYIKVKMSVYVIYTLHTCMDLVFLRPLVYLRLLFSFKLRITQKKFLLLFFVLKFKSIYQMATEKTVHRWGR